MNELTTAEIDVLMEAIEHWSKDTTGALIGGLLGSMVGKDEDERKKFREQSKSEAEARISERRGRSIRIMAKLLDLRDRAVVNSATRIQP